ncbi:MAG: acyltransferase [Prevotella sp.]|jgi:maltose O-acetyltransferase|nr:acyltransferase [Prevotella sp.]MCH4017744.1 acyltransferase [Prevotella sp.]
MIKIILLQCKFLLVAFLNLTYNLVPNPLRNGYLRIFGIRVHSGSTIHRYCRFFHVGKLTIGKNSTVNFGCYLDNRRGIRIGNNVGLAHHVKIYTLGHDIDDPMFKTKGKPVILEDGVFVFANVLIMPGVTLHKNCVILPGSVVTKDIDANAVAGGNPAKVLRYRSVKTPPQSYPYWFAL